MTSEQSSFEKNGFDSSTKSKFCLDTALTESALESRRWRAVYRSQSQKGRTAKVLKKMMSKSAREVCVGAKSEVRAVPNGICKDHDSREKFTDTFLKST